MPAQSARTPNPGKRNAQMQYAAPSPQAPHEEERNGGLLPPSSRRRRARASPDVALPSVGADAPRLRVVAAREAHDDPRVGIGLRLAARVLVERGALVVARRGSRAAAVGVVLAPRQRRRRRRRRRVLVVHRRGGGCRAADAVAALALAAAGLARGLVVIIEDPVLLSSSMKLAPAVPHCVDFFTDSEMSVSN